MAAAIDSPCMDLIDALNALHEVRGDTDVVVATMASAREWMNLGTHPLDFIYAPSAMGEAPALALGLALAQPQRRVVVLNGDGCMLMNLGCLVTISAAAPENLTLIVCDNSVYEVTGGQKTAAAAVSSAGSAVDFCQMARGAGLSSVWEFRDLDDWRREIDSVLSARGPRFILWKVAPIPGGAVPKSPAPAISRARQFAAALR